MQQATWLAIIGIYLLGVLTMMGASQIPPLIGDIAGAYGVSHEAVGWSISGFFLAGAFGSVLTGWFADRFGLRITLLIGMVLFVVGDLCAIVGPTMWWFTAGRILAGAGWLSTIVACPALLMGMTTGRRQVQAMSLWSTFAAGGWILGPLLSATVAGSALWRWSFIVHGIVMVFVVLACALLLRPPVRAHQTPVNGQSNMRTVLGQANVWRLSLSYSFQVIAGLGIASIVPIYFSTVHQVSATLGSTLLAASMVLTFISGVGTGVLLSRGVPLGRLIAVISVGAIISGIGMFAPFLGFNLAVASLMLWGLAVGGLIATQLTLLPRVVSDPAQGAAAAGLFNQIGGIFCVIAPALILFVFERGTWREMAGLIVISWVIAIALLPIWGRRLRAVAAGLGQRA